MLADLWPRRDMTKSNIVNMHIPLVLSLVGTAHLQWYFEYLD